MVTTHTFETASSPPHRAPEGEVEFSSRTRLQVETEGVESTGQLPVVVEILVVVALVISIEIMVARDLVVSDSVDNIVNNSEPKRLMAPGRKPLPA